MAAVSFPMDSVRRDVVRVRGCRPELHQHMSKLRIEREVQSRRGVRVLPVSEAVAQLHRELCVPKQRCVQHVLRRVLLRAEHMGHVVRIHMPGMGQLHV